MKTNKFVRSDMPASTRAVFDSPLEIPEPALIISDLEVPFHNADFVTQVCNLAGAWGVRNLVLAGDAVHWESLSGWGPGWEETPKPVKDNKELLDFLAALDDKTKSEGLKLLEKMGVIPTDKSVSGELAEIRQALRFFNRNFDNIFWVLGNHEDRLLRRLQASLSTDDLLSLMETGDKWKSAPYYWCVVRCANGESFRVTHPGGASNGIAGQIASRTHMHVISGHTHKWIQQKDPSGRYWTIHAGHCVDEARLRYVQTRDRGGWDAHCLGAVIVRNGYPWLLGKDTPFEEMAKMR